MNVLRFGLHDPTLQRIVINSDEVCELEIEGSLALVTPCKMTAYYLSNKRRWGSPWMMGGMWWKPGFRFEVYKSNQNRGMYR